MMRSITFGAVFALAQVHAVQDEPRMWHEFTENNKMKEQGIFDSFVDYVRDYTSTFFGPPKDEVTVESKLAQAPELNIWQVFRKPVISLQEHNEHFCPDGHRCNFNWRDDGHGMDRDMREACQELAAAGVVSGGYEAYSMIRPIALKADVWRIARLWASGGLYMDHKVVLGTKIDKFIDISRDGSHHIFLPLSTNGVTANGHIDHGRGSPRRAIQNSMLYATRNHPALEFMIKLQIDHAKNRWYGGGPTEPTGPIALFNGFDEYLRSQKSHGIRAAQRDVQWIKTQSTPSRYRGPTKELFAVGEIENEEELWGNRVQIEGGTISNLEVDAKFIYKGKAVAFFDAHTHAEGRSISVPYKAAYWAHHLYCEEGHPNCGEPHPTKGQSMVNKVKETFRVGANSRKPASGSKASQLHM